MKRLIKKLALFILCTVLLCQSTTVTYAYTKEEVEAAKAWLSGHGYSPDAAGAAQAYQDYLNGKFGGTPTQTEETDTDQDGNQGTEGTNGEAVTKDSKAGNGGETSTEVSDDTKETEPTNVSGSNVENENPDADATDEQKENIKEAVENKADFKDDKDVAVSGDAVSGNTVSGANVDEAVIKEIEKAMDSKMSETLEDKKSLERPENAYNKEETMAQKPDRSAEVKVILACTGVAVIFVCVFVFLKYFRNKNKNR